MGGLFDCFCWRIFCTEKGSRQIVKYSNINRFIIVNFKYTLNLTCFTGFQLICNSKEGRWCTFSLMSSQLLPSSLQLFFDEQELEKERFGNPYI